MCATNLQSSDNLYPTLIQNTSQVDVVLDLHHFVVGRIGTAETLDLASAGRVEGGLVFDIERVGASAAPVHQAPTNE